MPIRTKLFIFRLLLLSALAAPIPLHGAGPDPDPLSLRDDINALDPAQVEKALEAIRSTFLSPQSLDEPSKQKALLEGLVRRLAPGVEIVRSETPPSAPEPFVSEILDDRDGYLRPGRLDAETLAQLDASLASFAEKKLPAVILDLRSVAGGSSFDAAADFARRFCPNGKMLFTIQKPSARQERILTSNQTPAFGGILVVLTDSGTSGAAEALAATLRSNAGAMIVGDDTSGKAVEFADIPLDGDKSLRVAVARVVLPDGTSIFPAGLKPDLRVSMPAAELAEIFAASRKEGVGRFVFGASRPRMSEAALLTNTNPEIEPTKPPPPAALCDTVLQRAVDLVTAINFHKGRH
jgi:hypothetical protein